MKKITLSVLVCFFTLISCTKEENTSSDNFNQMDYNGINFKLGNKGSLLYNDNGTVNLLLYSSSIAWNENSEWLTGKGDYIWFGLNLPGAGSIIEDRFEFNSDGLPGYLVEGAILIGYNPDDYNDGYEYAGIESGYVELKYNEAREIYTIDFEVDLNTDKSVKGNFTGNIQNFTRKNIK